MKAERFVLSFIAVLIGLLVAGGGFYLYQLTHKPSSNKSQTITIKNLTPTPDSNNVLTVDSPKDEEIATSKTIKVTGHTVKDATIIASAPSNDSVVKPSANGDFSLTLIVSDGANPIQITAIFPNGEEKKVVRTVSFTTQDF